MDNYYNQIKDTLINNIIYRKVKDYSKNKNDLESYYLVGKLIVEAQGGLKRAKYGDNLIKVYSKKLKTDLSKNFNSRILWRARNFYLLFNKEKVSTLSTQLTWSHYVELLPLNNINIINYYIKVCEERNLSVRQLRELIKSNEYERLNDNTKYKLINKKNNSIDDFIKDPIIINNNLNYENISEKVLQQLILNDIPSFLKQLGNGFTFIDKEYPIKIGNQYNYILEYISDRNIFTTKYITI